MAYSLTGGRRSLIFCSKQHAGIKESKCDRRTTRFGQLASCCMLERGAWIGSWAVDNVSLVRILLT